MQCIFVKFLQCYYVSKGILTNPFCIDTYIKRFSIKIERKETQARDEKEYKKFVYIVGKRKKERRTLTIPLMPPSMVFSWDKPPSMLMKEERPMRINKSSTRRREQEKVGEFFFFL